MALHAADLLTPRGRLNGAALWPHLSVEEREETIETYLDQGYSQAGASADQAATHWAEYRAFDDVYQRLSAMPSSVSTSDQGSAGYTQGQIDSWKALADDALAEYDAVIAEAAGTDTGYAVITSLR